MNIKSFLGKFGIHFIAVGIFLIVGAMYFSPQLSGHGVIQHDIEMHKGMSNEVTQYREINGEEPLWTNSMFGGMPSTQISIVHHGNIVRDSISRFLRLMPIPLGGFILHLVCFYIFAMCIRIKPIIAILGAFAFAFSSYEIIILAAGHNTKSLAVAFLPAVLGAFIYAYRTNWKLGTALSAIFMSLEIASNHLQVTYYFGFLLLGLGIYFLVEAIKTKKLKQFAFSTGGLFAAYIIALMINFGNITSTNSYAEYTTRGGTDLSIDSYGRDKIPNDGLELSYITGWSYGLGESFTLISPYVKGSHSSALEGSGLEDLTKKIEYGPGEDVARTKASIYWGEQSFVAGPFYLGVIVIFLAFLALFFVKDRSIWVMFGVAILALLLSWGKNFMGLTEFFVNNVPGYNMFRTVTIILVLVELLIPVLAVILLQKIYNERKEIAAKKKLFLIASGSFMLVLIVIKFSGGPFLTENESVAVSQTISDINAADPRGIMQNYNVDTRDQSQVEELADNLVGNRLAGAEKIRGELYSKSTTRTILFGFLTIGLCALFFYTSISSTYIVAGLGLLLLIDIVPVNRTYLGKGLDAKGNMKHWQLNEDKNYPITANEGDDAIMEAELAANPKLSKAIKEGEARGNAKADELGYEGRERNNVIDSYKFGALNFATNYRVFNNRSLWNDTKASYFHKSIGGYHGAKLRNIQNVFEFQLNPQKQMGMNPVMLDILNVKYVIANNAMQVNRRALGNAWAVRDIKEFKSPNDEIRGLGSKFKLTNVGSGEIYINDKKVTDPNVYGEERLVYLLNGQDSIRFEVEYELRLGQTKFSAVNSQGVASLKLEGELAQDTVSGFLKMVQVECVEAFAPAQEALMLSSEAKKLSAKQFTGEAEVKMTSYQPNKMVYNATAKGTQLIVFSEIYYPIGWKAYVDGKEQEILKVDYFLRGLELKDGKHKIEFVYDDVTYHKAAKFAYTGSVLLFLLVGGILFLYFKEEKSKKIEGKVEEKEEA